MNTGRTIIEACNRAAKVEKSIQPETLWDMRSDDDTARSILGNVYVMGYLDAKKLSGKWNNPIPTWNDFKAMLNSWWIQIRNIPRYIISRFGKFGNRKIVVLVRKEIDAASEEVFRWPGLSLSRNGWKFVLGHTLEEKFVERGLIKSFKVVNNDPKADGCIWINEQGLNGHVEVHLRNCDEVVQIEFNMPAK